MIEFSGDAILVEEARQIKALSKIADMISSRKGVKLVLLCGPSSAGKTTTAKRLAIQLQVDGYSALSMSTDDYFVGDELNPRDENGELDYEHVDCVDAAELEEDLSKLIRGETITPRRFDFQKHVGFRDTSKSLTLPENGIIILEGIHALNPKLTGHIASDKKFKIFIHCSKTRRFYRRLVRDSHYRNMNAAETIAIWPKVLKGEEKWINPHRSEADVEFESSLPYEFGVLRPFVEKMLASETPELLAPLIEYAPIPAKKVPGDSILRETIGESLLEY